jgi:hypothetical protein
VNEYVESICCGVMAGRRVLAAGTRGGRLKLWDAENGEHIALNDHAHQYAIDSLAFVHLAHFDMLVSAGRDGVLRFWSNTLLLLDQIDIGDPITATLLVNSDIAVGTGRGMLLIRPHTSLGEGPPGSRQKLPYQVIVHDPLTGQDRREGFANLKAALAACESIVVAEMSRLREREPELSPRRWLDQYMMFGLVPHVVGGRDDGKQFSALEYAKEKAIEASGRYER